MTAAHVFLFDLDGTLTATELLPLLAREVGLEQEVRLLTAQTMAGEIPFDQSFRARVAMLREIPVETAQEIMSGIPVHSRLLDWVIENRDRCWVVTSNLDCWVEPWLQAKGLRSFTSHGVVHDGRTEVGSILTKASVLAEFHNSPTVMVGDGANDADIMLQADVGIAFAVRHMVADVVMETADYLIADEEALCQLLSRL